MNGFTEEVGMLRVYYGCWKNSVAALQLYRRYPNRKSPNRRVFGKLEANWKVLVKYVCNNHLVILIHKKLHNTVLNANKKWIVNLKVLFTMLSISFAQVQFEDELDELHL